MAFGPPSSDRFGQVTDKPPALHTLAGPNGAGKSTLCAALVRRLTDAEFVNADDL
jgi:ABC-type cobalamin/Fe3+-siderophores transport system ATPase subunit